MSEIIKFGLLGTSCTGKTTLLEMCREELREDDVRDVICVEEAAREWFGRHPEVTDRFGMEAQCNVQALALQKEQRAHSLAARRMGRLSVILTDRTVYDAPVYVFSQGDIQGAESLLERVRLWRSSYDQIFLLDPMDVPYGTDDIRTESSADRMDFHKAFVEFFGTHDVPYSLLSGSLAERFQKIEEAVNQRR